MSPEYLAGYLDGEACVYIYETPNRPGLMMGVSVASAWKPIIEKLHEKFGGTFQLRETDTKNAWSWAVQGAAAYAVLSICVQHMDEKKEQSKLAMRFWEWRLTQPKRGVKWNKIRHLSTKIKRLKQKDFD